MVVPANGMSTASDELGAPKAARKLLIGLIGARHPALAVAGERMNRKRHQPAGLAAALIS